MSVKKHISLKTEYKHFVELTTRWKDNDVYGHINNVAYYSYFDTAVNQYLIEEGGLDIHTADEVGFVVASNCEYHSPIAYPDKLVIGVKVNKLGHRSVTYGIAIFKQGDESAVAHGSFTHVFVNRQTNSSVEIPENIRTALQRIL